MDFGLKQGDTGTPLMAVLYNPDGSVVDLTGSTVKFIMAKTNGTTVYSANTVEWDIKVNAVAEIFSTEGGTVQYIFTDKDVAEFGDFLGEFEVTYPNKRVETFPNGNSQIQINIYPDIR